MVQIILKMEINITIKIIIGIGQTIIKCKWTIVLFGQPFDETKLRSTCL